MKLILNFNGLVNARDMENFGLMKNILPISGDYFLCINGIVVYDDFFIFHYSFIL